MIFDKYYLFIFITLLSSCGNAPFQQEYKARPYDTVNMCYKDNLESIDYEFQLGGCNDAETVAEDINGKCWLFNNGCIPSSFKESDYCESLGVIKCSQKK